MRREVFERQLQLVDLALDLFRTRPEVLRRERGNAVLERLDQRFGAEGAVPTLLMVR